MHKFIKILEMFLPTYKVFESTFLVRFEKKYPTHIVIRAPRLLALLGTLECVSKYWLLLKTA